jgi:diaminopimelate epimerase
MPAEPAARVPSSEPGLAFVKMHGLGNDFVVIEASDLERPLDATTVRRLADRRLGVGCDQLLLLDATREPLRYRVFNADGNEVEQCGNGARCVARYAAEHGLARPRDVRLESAAGPVAARVAGDNASISLGVPRFEPDALPFDAPGEGPPYALDVGGETVTFGALSVGNPHAVIEVASVDDAPVARLGPLVANHPRFARGVNVGFVEFIDADHCRLRVYERGVGETPACGTGAAAAAVFGRATERLAARVTVSLTGGNLVVDWPGPDHAAWLTGPAIPVFKGRIE